MVIFVYFQPIFVAIHVTIATIKVNLMPDFYNWTIVIINLPEEVGEKQFLFFVLIGGRGGGANLPLIMALD